MATIDECFKLVKYRATKGGYLGTISPDDFNLLWPRAEMRYFNSQYKVYGETQKINDTIAKVKTDPLPITVDSNGLYPIPADLLHVDAITHVYNGIEVEVTEVQDDRKANYLSSAYDAPDLEFPIYLRYATTLKFYPVNIGNAILVYLKKPTSSYWGYTMTGSVLSTSTLIGGTGYTNGTYNNVKLTGGLGKGVQATVVIAGGVVTSVTITNTGVGYAIGDVLSASNTSIGGTGTGFSINVASISSEPRPVYNVGNSVQPVWSDTDIDQICYLVLADLGINFRDSELENFALTQEKINA